MNQRQFNDDLLVTGDDTLEDAIPLPENEEGYEDNPIRRLFEQTPMERVKD
jgi:hypothetical protein